MSSKPFSELGLAPELLQAIERLGFEQATPVQAGAIPPLLAGRDLVGQSQTGSGKTLAFAAPAVQLVDPSQRVVQVLVLCPTRELATQVAEEIAKLAHFKRGVRELPIYGGQSYDRQFRGLQAGPQIVIGTPGRVIDHLSRGTLRLDTVRLVVLDEADRMLDMGFREDLERILQAVPDTRQTALFSATLPPLIRRLVARYTRDPVQIHLTPAQVTVPAIEQSYVEVDWRSKTEVLSRFLDLDDVRSGLVFCTTKLQVDELQEALAARGYNADKLHGDMPQTLRERVLRRFRERRVELLVATDVAARGLDVDNLEVVFNYELPPDPEDYVHRIGRTGRAGKAGRAISLVSGREFGRLQQIQRFIGMRIPLRPVPRVEELEQKTTGRLVETLRRTLESGAFKRRDALFDELTGAGYSPGDIVSALLHLLRTESGRSPERIPEDEPRTPRAAARTAPVGGTPARPRFEPHGPARRGTGGDMAWLKFNLGANAGVAPGDFVGCIAGETGLPREVVGAIRILPGISLVEVARAHLPRILEAVNRTRLKGRRVLAMPGAPPALGPRPYRLGPAGQR